MILEFDRRLLRAEYHGNIDAMRQDKCYKAWTPDNIKGAFNAGHGTKRHLKQYMKNNAQYAIFMEA